MPGFANSASSRLNLSLCDRHRLSSSSSSSSSQKGPVKGVQPLGVCPDCKKPPPQEKKKCMCKHLSFARFHQRHLAVHSLKLMLFYLLLVKKFHDMAKRYRIWVHNYRQTNIEEGRDPNFGLDYRLSKNIPWIMKVRARNPFRLHMFTKLTVFCILPSSLNF